MSETTGAVTTVYGYDANGNRSSRTVGGHADLYSYDDENRLVEVDYERGLEILVSFSRSKSANGAFS